MTMQIAAIQKQEFNYCFRHFADVHFNSRLRLIVVSVSIETDLTPYQFLLLLTVICNVVCSCKAQHYEQLRILHRLIYWVECKES
jgi:hypothetical protein